MGIVKKILVGLTIILAFCKKTASGQERMNEPQIDGSIVAPHFRYGRDSLLKHLNHQIKLAKLCKLILVDFDHYALVLTISERGKLLKSRCMVNCYGNERFTKAMTNILEQCEWVAGVETNDKGESFVRTDEIILIFYIDPTNHSRIVSLVTR